LKGTVAEPSPQGKLKREIRLSAREQTNLAFGGIDGKTVFVTRIGGEIRAESRAAAAPSVQIA
jgi:sugar lactone lactonase YvrE